MGDSLHLRQVLMNLVGNAIKFAPQGRVVLGVHPVGDEASDQGRFEVSDSGFGIDLSQQEKIFEPFAMGGELGVVSAPGKGSTFGFDLTLARAPALAGVQPGTTEAPGAGKPTNSRVLLVEDNPVNQMICSAMLTTMGLEVVLAEDGAACVKKESLQALLAPWMPPAGA
jgi:nitrogen-specific signal transduction histidine kinase